jgi:hypothetical protein
VTFKQSLTKLLISIVTSALQDEYV